MATASILYQESLRCAATHLASGNTIITDAPTDNFGKGEFFSPTDLLATALGTCIVTTIAIYAQNHDVPFYGATAQITKIMASSPRRVSEVAIIITLNQNQQAHERLRLEAAGNACPVAKSLHPNLIQNITYHYA
jgi:putative redox protein